MPDLEVALAASVRWLDLTALAGVVGGIALETIVLPGPSADDARTRRRLAVVVGIGLVALAVAGGGELLVRAHTMADGDGRAALAAAPLVLRMTHFGRVWCLRAGGLAVLALLRTSRARTARGIALAIALGLAVTTTLTGHAADGGDATLAVLADWLHVAAASVWTGGLFGLALAVLPAARDAADPSWIGATVRRFSRLAAVCAALVVASGAYNVWTSVNAVAALWTSAYGRVLVAKLLVVGGVLAIAAANRYRMVPALAPPKAAGNDAGTPPAVAGIASWVARETALVLVVFACTALLGQLPPPRHDAAAHGAPDHATHGDAAHD